MDNRKYPSPILVVDDEEAILAVMAANLEKRNLDVHTALTGGEAVKKVKKHRYATIILDYNLPDTNGFKVLDEIKQEEPQVPVIFITAYGTIEMAVEAMKAGAYNYLVKPINYDELTVVVDKALEHHRLQDELNDYRKQFQFNSPEGGIIGRSKVMQKLYEQVLMVAESDATVLIRGETGTGKEMIARAIHANSPRKDRPFVRINCAAIPETLLEAELFGHEKGAFTGAIRQKPGKFEQANGGTIYLDEIGDISPAVQTKLLRILQEGEYDRVGGTETLATDARVIATTNRNLEKAIREHQFREDLFYRLNVIPIFLPPLKERKEDIPLMVHYFTNKYATKNGKTITAIPPSFTASLMEHHWPGNVRELENFIERAVVLTQGETLITLDLPNRNGNGISGLNNGGGLGAFKTAKKQVVESFEAHYLAELLRKNKGNISASAKEAGLDYKNFHSKLKKYNINRKEFEV